MYCNYCGGKVPSGSKFCNYCGKKLPIIEMAEASSDALKQNDTRPLKDTPIVERKISAPKSKKNSITFWAVAETIGNTLFEVPFIGPFLAISFMLLILFALFLSYIGITYWLWNNQPLICCIWITLSFVVFGRFIWVSSGWTSFRRYRLIGLMIFMYLMIVYACLIDYIA